MKSGKRSCRIDVLNLFFKFFLDFFSFYHILQIVKSMISNGLVERPRSIYGGEVPRLLH